MKRSVLSVFTGLLFLGLICQQAEAAEPKYFQVGNHQAFVIEPPEASQIDGPMPWVFYAPTFIRRLPGAEENWMIGRLHDRGIAIAGIDVGESYGSPQGRAAYQALYEQLTTCLLYTSPSPRDQRGSRMPSSA